MATHAPDTITFIDSSFRSKGDTTRVTIITRKELGLQTGPADQIREYLSILIWPLTLLLIAWWLKKRLTELEGFGAKAKFGDVVDVASKKIEELKAVESD